MIYFQALKHATLYYHNVQNLVSMLTMDFKGNSDKYWSILINNLKILISTWETNVMLCFFFSEVVSNLN